MQWPAIRISPPLAGQIASTVPCGFCGGRVSFADTSVVGSIDEVWHAFGNRASLTKGNGRNSARSTFVVPDIRTLHRRRRFGAFLASVTRVRTARCTNPSPESQAPGPAERPDPLGSYSQMPQTLIRSIEKRIVLDYPAFLSFFCPACPSEAAFDDTMTGRTSTRAVLIAIGKALITISAIAIIVSQVDFAFLLSHWHKLGAFTLAASVILLASQTSLIAGLRLKFVLEALGRNRRLSETVQVALSGFFFEQVAFGFVGGDAMRLWLLHRTDMPWRTAVQAIVIDRCFGSVGLFLLALVGLPGLIGLLTGYDWRVIVAAGVIAVLLAGGLF